MKKQCHNTYFSRLFSAIEDFVLSYSQGLDSHNPYFSRWFSAMQPVKVLNMNLEVTILILVDGFLQYKLKFRIAVLKQSHNPYFSRWFSAIDSEEYKKGQKKVSQSLFQQMVFCNKKAYKRMVTRYKRHNPYFSRWFSAIKE